VPSWTLQMQPGHPAEAAEMTWPVWIAAARSGGWDGGEEDIRSGSVWDTSAVGLG